jgi:hypothetical protein
MYVSCRSARDVEANIATCFLSLDKKEKACRSSIGVRLRDHILQGAVLRVTIPGEGKPFKMEGISWR